MDKINKKILEARLGCSSAKELAQELCIAESTLSRSIDTQSIQRKLRKLAAAKGVDIEDILMAEDAGKRVDLSKPPKPEPPMQVRQPGQEYDPHGGWKPRAMSEEWQLAGMAVEVLTSGTIYAEALKQNIKAFYEAYLQMPAGEKNEKERGCPGKTSVGGG